MAEANEVKRRAALIQAALATIDSQRLLQDKNRPGASYERDAQSIAESSLRFGDSEALGLAIFKILQKHHGSNYRAFDTFAFAKQIQKLFGD